MAKIYRAHLLGTVHHSKLLAGINSPSPSGNDFRNVAQFRASPFLGMSSNDAVIAFLELAIQLPVFRSLLIRDDVFQPWGSNMDLSSHASCCAYPTHCQVLKHFPPTFKREVPSYNGEMLSSLSH